MKKIDLGRAISILANVGIIAGIVFLALELEQNSRILSAQAQFSIASVQIDQIRSIIENSDLADLPVRAVSGEELSDSDQIRLWNSARLYFVAWEWEFLQIQAGNLDDDGTLSRSVRDLFERPERTLIPRAIFEDAWLSLDQAHHPDFREFVEDIRSSIGSGE